MSNPSEFVDKKENTAADGKKKFPVLLVLIPILIAIAGAVFWFSTRNSASSMRLARLEGIVQLQDEQGKEKTLVENMRFQSGQALRTEEASLVGINLDDTKLATLDALSRSQFIKKLKKIQLKLSQGRVFFEVTKDLAADETFDIETSTMVVGIRGTSGYVEVDEQGQESLVVTDGHVHVIGTNPVTGEVKETDVYAGEGVTVYLFNDRKVDSIEFHLEEVHEKDLPLLALRLMVESDEHWTEDGKYLPPDGSIPDADDRPFDEGEPGLDVPEGHMLAGEEGRPDNAAGGQEGTGLAPSGTPAAEGVPKDGSLMDKVCVGANWSQELIHYYYEKVSNGEAADGTEEAESSEEETSEEETSESLRATEEETEESSEEESSSETETETPAPSATAATQAPTQAPTQAAETAAAEQETAAASSEETQAPSETAAESAEEASDDTPEEESGEVDPENIDYDLTDEDDPNNLPDDPNNLPEETSTEATQPVTSETEAPAAADDSAGTVPSSSEDPWTFISEPYSGDYMDDVMGST